MEESIVDQNTDMSMFPILSKTADIYGETFSFTLCNVLDNISAALPTEFIILPDKYAKLKYPLTARPKAIFSSLDTTVNLCFDSTDLVFEPYDKRMTAYKGIMLKMNPTYKMLDDGRRPLLLQGKHVDENSVNFKEVHYYTYKSDFPNDSIFNMTFFTDIDRTELFGFFNCPFDKRQVWFPWVLQIIQTIHRPVDQSLQELTASK